VWRTSHVEFTLALIAWIGVIVLGVEAGLALAVALAILAQTWRAARPKMIEMGRREGTTSWEPYDAKAVQRVDHILAIFFDEDLFFANAGVFRRELHDMMRKYPATRHVVLDAVAISDIDFTGLATLSQVAADLDRDHISLSFARSNAAVLHTLHHAQDQALSRIKTYDSVDAAATHALNDK
jgi:MFS superfamily sulfate permease-like transporter